MGSYSCRHYINYCLMSLKKKDTALVISDGRQSSVLTQT